MRLHNRQIKASFWNDPDIVLWSRDKRMFYIGLAQLADDSGCFEDSPAAFQLQLYPSRADIDITVNIIGSWRDELIADGRLVPYQAGVDGKSYLFMRNFHRHQTLNKPAPPSKSSIPLPPWVTWAPSNNPKSRDGKYIILEESVPRPGHAPDVSWTRTGHVPPEPEPEPEPQPEGEKDIPAAAAADDHPAPAKVQEVYPDPFEEFWRVYPRKTEKRRAYKAWRARIKGGAQAAMLVEAAQHYAAGCRKAATEERFIKHPSSFLGPDKPYEELLQPRASPESLGETRAGKYDHLIMG